MHSNEQMRASWDAAGKSISQRSQLGRSSSMASSSAISAFSVTKPAHLVEDFHRASGTFRAVVHRGGDD
ncbi:hypothetical protein [uncultured Pantoea sp.]|uniref:hypothetical protein n=1 Tax=uncultured Pantoea sp. TaxID=218084 RepID=UPI00258ABFB6|nr:hypothetical protein [uncultured Pantoea sp.]